jgi:hypothetical protein
VSVRSSLSASSLRLSTLPVAVDGVTLDVGPHLLEVPDAGRRDRGRLAGAGETVPAASVRSE